MRAHAHPRMCVMRVHGTNDRSVVLKKRDESAPHAPTPHI